MLKEFASSLTSYARKSDLVFRYGGEEFFLLLPNTDITGATHLAEVIRKKFEEKIYHDGTNSKTITISIGAASLNQHNPAKPKDLLNFADTALYMAKFEGRNCVKVYTEHSPKNSKGQKEQIDLV
jgi:diguanylate cyclase (GGDEF)-like protein